MDNKRLRCLTAYRRCRLAHHDVFDSCVVYSGVKQCKLCLTEYQIDSKNIDNKGVTLVVTVWQDFGTVTTPFDIEWRRHFHYDKDRSAKYSIKEAFEGGAHFYFDAHITKADGEALEMR